MYYIDTDKELFNNDSSGSQIKVVVPDGSIKIFVKKDGFNFIKEARRVELDGTRFSIKSDGSPFGLTGNLFYTFYLFPLDESEE